jgi:Lon protease-like protein
MSDLELPLFPLHTVLFPGGPLPLRIFEARYIDMVSACMKSGTGFGVCLIREGSEVGTAAATHDIGTLALIQDWHQRHDGLLGITVLGQQRFELRSVRVQSDQLSWAKVDMLAPEPSMQMPERHLVLVDVLRRTIEGIGSHYAQLPTHYADASWVGYRLAELLPLKLSQKQYFLQIDDPVQRLDGISELMRRFDSLM